MWNVINKIIIRSGFFMFNKNSGLVKIWFGAVLNEESPYKFADVPNLSNLRPVVKEQLHLMGYDTENENAA